MYSAIQETPSLHRKPLGMQEGGQTAVSSYHCNPGLQVQSAHPCEPLPPSPLLLLLCDDTINNVLRNAAIFFLEICVHRSHPSRSCNGNSRTVTSPKTLAAKPRLEQPTRLYFIPSFCFTLSSGSFWSLAAQCKHFCKNKRSMKHRHDSTLQITLFCFIVSWSSRSLPLHRADFFARTKAWSTEMIQHHKLPHSTHNFSTTIAQRRGDIVGIATWFCLRQKQKQLHQ